jgi:hypothetical protein
MDCRDQPHCNTSVEEINGGAAERRAPPALERAFPEALPHISDGFRARNIRRALGSLLRCKFDAGEGTNESSSRHPSGDSCCDTKLETEDLSASGRLAGVFLL